MPEKMDLPNPTMERLVCRRCRETFSEADLREFREMGEEYHREGTFFLCPDCFDDFYHMDGEDQVEFLLNV